MKETAKQLTILKNGANLSTHSFFNVLAEALKEKIKETTGLDLVLVGKSVAGHGISATLTGEVVITDDNADVNNKVKKTMQELRNPANLMAILK